jgi:heat shock protein HtpX
MLSSTLKTYALLAALALTAAAVGFIVLGGVGLVIGAGVFALLSVVGLRLPEELVLRFQGGVPMERAPYRRRLVPERVAVLAQRASIAAPRLFYTPGLEANAMALRTGEGPGALAITRGALELLADAELDAVLAHEIAHLKHGDTELLSMSAMVSRALGGLLRIATWMAFFSVLLTGGGMQRATVLALLALTAPLLIGWLRAALSRTREHAADVTAARLTGQPRALASALVKLERYHHGWLDRAIVIPEWLRSHPPTQERVLRLLRMPERDPIRGYGVSAATNTSSAPWLTI